jgi:uncharacterized cupin superfamily protein
MVEEAHLGETPSGLAPETDGWFVVSVADAAWRAHDDFGSSCVFEREGAPFADLGIRVRVLSPGQPNGMYHAESGQEDFLVLAGECVLLIEEQERRLRAWDFVHCPGDTRHIFVGAGEGPCVLLMVGARKQGASIVYPVSELARRYGAGVETETGTPAEAYASFSRPRPGRPEMGGLPWAT